MKKLIAMLLCVALVAALSVSAFAAPTAEQWASETVPSATAPKDVVGAVTDAGYKSTMNDTAADAATVASALAALDKLDQAYLKVIKNPKSTATEIADAKTEYDTDVAALVASWASVTMKDGTTTLDSAVIEVGSLKVDMSDYSSYDISTVTDPTKTAAAGNGTANKAGAAAKLVAAGWQNSVIYDLSNQTLMDANALSIGNATTDMAAVKADAVKAAAAAKSAASAAQATAKSLINDAVKYAQDAAAAQVANAQTAAYNNVANAYAVAVADFWADVAEAVADMAG
jgi:hypothetical protein